MNIAQLLTMGSLMRVLRPFWGDKAQEVTDQPDRLSLLGQWHPAHGKDASRTKSVRQFAGFG